MMELTRENIINLLDTNDRAVIRALLALNARQNVDEQIDEQSKYNNGRGFKRQHARMGTSMAKFYEERGFLSAKQIRYWRVRDKNGISRIGCYAGQLLEVAIEKLEHTYD